jgi:general stress protein YciG
MAKQRCGFRAMPKSKVKKIARKGGKASAKARKRRKRR